VATTPGGSFRINNEDDLKKAISAAGSVAGGDEEKARVRKLVMSKAKSLGLAKLIPTNWNADGTIAAAKK
jgi:hypothetical protein